MIRSIFLLVLFAGVFAAPFEQNFDNIWNAYKKLFNKTYNSLEEGTRRYVWEVNVANIQKHNLEADLNLHSFTLGVNHLTDRFPHEYSRLNGLKINNATKSYSTFLAPENVDYPKSIDWREKGFVTDIKDQGQCGSCWAFTAVGSLEGQHKRATGKLVSLSEQNLVDCAGDEGNHGCNGGMIDSAFAYIKINHGIDTEESYPYIAKLGKCHFMKKTVGATLTGWVDIKSFDENALMKAVATVGPVSVAINSEGYGFNFYKGGVYDVKKCDPYQLTHGVLIVGYGTENGLEYWLVKNSWGRSWGEEGYIKMRRNKNLCGISMMASYPLV